MSALDEKVAALAARYRPLAARILREAIRIPADYVDRPVERGRRSRSAASATTRARGSSTCGATIVEIGAVRRPEDVGFDAFGNLVWVVEDEADGIPARDKRVIYMDGHTDTVKALRPQWREKTNGGIDAYDGLVDLARVDRARAARGCSATCRPTTSGSTCCSAAARPTSSPASCPRSSPRRSCSSSRPEGALRGVDRARVRARSPRRTTTAAARST